MPEINEALLGVLPGQTRRFRKSFPEDFPNEEFRGKTVDYEVTLAALKEKKLPAADDEFARMVAEGETLESLRERIRGSLRAEREAERRRRLRHAILDQLLSRVEVPAPEALVEAETESALRDYARYLSANGVDPQQADWQKLRDDARPGAERRVREYLLIDAIARKENVEVSETEVEAEFKRAAARRGLDPAVLREQMAKADGLNALRDEIRLSKTLDMMIDKAALTPARPAGNG
jgi:trigger factor